MKIDAERGPNEVRSWYLGVDLGTGSCKSVVIDEHARVLGFGTNAYAAKDTHGKWQEQNPEAILDGMVLSVRQALHQSGQLPGDCAGLSLGGALHSLLALDSSGAPLTGVMTWADPRAGAQAHRVRESARSERYYQQTGCPAHSMYPLYKIMWLREEQPAVFQQACHFLSAKEYIFQKLCGEYLVDYNLAAGSGLLNVHGLTWNISSLELAGIDAGQLGQLCSPSQILPGINPTLAGQMGISPQTPLTIGSSDAVNSSLGAGAVHPWQATLMVGTSGAYRLIANEPVIDPKGRTWCYAIDPGHWLVGGAINNGGIVLEWLLDAINQAIRHSPGNNPLTFEGLLNLAEQAPAGSGGVVCLPFFAGERSPNWKLNSRAVLYGLTLEHHFAHMARAMLEGVAFRFRSIQDAFDEMGLDIRQVRTSGGSTRSAFWMEMFASVLGRPLVSPGWRETSSLGAAIWAMQGSGTLEDFATLDELIPTAETTHPVPKDQPVYEGQYKLYSELYQVLVSLW